MAKVIKSVEEIMVSRIYRKRLGRVLLTADLAGIIRNFIATTANATTRGVGRRKMLQFLSARDTEARVKANTSAKMARLYDAIERGEVSGYKVDDTHTIYLVRDGGVNRCIVRTVEKPHSRVDWAAFAKAMGYTEAHARCMGCVTHYKGSDTIKECGKTLMDEFIKSTAHQLDEKGLLYPMVQTYVQDLLNHNED